MSTELSNILLDVLTTNKHCTVIFCSSTNRWQVKKKNLNEFVQNHSECRCKQNRGVSKWFEKWWGSHATAFTAVRQRSPTPSPKHQRGCLCGFFSTKGCEEKAQRFSWLGRAHAVSLRWSLSLDGVEFVFPWRQAWDRPLHHNTNGLKVKLLLFIWENKVNIKSCVYHRNAGRYLLRLGVFISGTFKYIKAPITSPTLIWDALIVRLPWGN